MRTVLTILILIVYPRVCRDAVYFTEIQPSGEPDQMTFPVEFQGSFLSVRCDSTSLDSHIVMIHSGTMMCTSVYRMAMARDSLQTISDARISNDTLYWLNDDFVSFSTFFPRNDSVVIRSKLVTSIFMPTDTSVLRTQAGRCFLNYLDKPSRNWYVELLSLVGDTLIHASVDLRKEEPLLRRHFKVGDDGPPFYLKSSKNGIGEYIGKGGFSRHDQFIRIKSDKQKGKKP